MIAEPRFFCLPLRRNIGYAAHIRTRDFAVLFAPLGGQAAGEQASEALFSKWASLVSERQPGRLISENKKTFTLYLVLSDQCNLKCTYCDVFGQIDHRLNGTHLSWDLAKISLDIVCRRLTADSELQAQIVFFGGEPLLNWALLVQICEFTAQKGLNHRIEKMLVTNGTLLNGEKALFLKQHQVYVVVSLDGRPATNDRIRVNHKGQGSFSTVAEGISHLIEVMPLQFGISCTLGSHNGRTLSEEIGFLHERFQPLCIGINIYHYLQDGTSPVDMDEDLLCQALIDAFLTARKKGIAIYQFIGILRAFISRQRNRDYCPACVDKLLFTPQGRVGRCETLMFDERFTVSAEEVLATGMPKRLDWSKFTPEHEPACLSCAARWICPGTCVYDQFVRTGLLEGVQTRRCLFHRQLLTEMLDLVLDEIPKDNDPSQVFIPCQQHFDQVAGLIPMSFPAHTIWIVSLASVMAQPIKGLK